MKPSKAFLIGAALCLAFFLCLSGTAGASFPRTVVDGLGYELYLPAPPQRIFSAGLAMDNILLTLTDPERVVGVTIYASQPQWSYVTHRVREHMVQIAHLDPERILSARPDLVLVARWSDQEAVQQLRDLGLPVYTFTGFTGVLDSLENVQRMGELVGAEEEARRLVHRFWERYAEVARRINGRARPRVLGLDAWGTVTGRNTSTHDVIEMAGGRNVAAEHGIEGWRPIGTEGIIALQPEVIITNSGEDFVRDLLSDPVLAQVPAIRDGRVYHVDHVEALNHHVIRAIEALAELLHPEVDVP